MFKRLFFSKYINKIEKLEEEKQRYILQIIDAQERINDLMDLRYELNVIVHKITSHGQMTINVAIQDEPVTEIIPYSERSGVDIMQKVHVVQMDRVVGMVEFKHEKALNEASIKCKRLVAMYCGQYVEEKINEMDES